MYVVSLDVRRGMRRAFLEVGASPSTPVTPPPHFPKQTGYAPDMRQAILEAAPKHLLFGPTSFEARKWMCAGICAAYIRTNPFFSSFDNFFL
jgi:hypothetical protein